MVRLTELPPEKAASLRKLPCPEFESTPWVRPPPLPGCRLAIVSTAGIHLPGDRPFYVGAADYRVIAEDADLGSLVMTHVSRSFDRTGFNEDINVVFPVQRLRDMVDAGELGGLAAEHYSFMGATDPRAMEPAALELAGRLKEDSVDVVLLVPV